MKRSSEHAAPKVTLRAMPTASVRLEVLNVALVLFRCRARLERAEVAPFARLRILFARVQPVPAGGEFSDHGASFIANSVERDSTGASASPCRVRQIARHRSPRRANTQASHPIDLQRRPSRS